MRAEIRSIHSPDIPDLENYWPEDEANFCFYLELSISPLSEKGEEIFGITVCTPNWLADNHGIDEILFLRHHLLVFEYNYNRIIDLLRKKIYSFTANNWDELSSKISEIAYWEFEDYHEV